MSRSPPQRVAQVLVLVLLLAVPPVALAGEADYEPDDTHEHGAPYFGEARNLKDMAPMSDVRIKVQLKGTLRFFIVQTDDEGRFKRNGLGIDVNPDNVEFTCEKNGFRTVDVLSRRLSRDKLAPVEIECLLEKI